jgi:hypothetical protein
MKAVTKSTQPRRALRRDEYSWGIAWSGTPDQLLLAGVLDRATIDAVMARQRHQRGPRPEHRTIGGNRAQISRESSGRLNVYEEFSQDESIRRAAAREAAKSLAALARSRDDFQRRARASAIHHLAGLIELLRSGDGGYRATPECIEAVEVAAAKVIDAIDAAEVIFSQRERDRIEAAIRGEAARDDAEFGRFLTAVGAK